MRLRALCLRTKQLGPNRRIYIYISLLEVINISPTPIIPWSLVQSTSVEALIPRAQ